MELAHNVVSTPDSLKGLDSLLDPSLVEQALQQAVSPPCASGAYRSNEMKLAEQLIDTTPDHSLTLFDRGFYSLGLLHQWQQAGTERHWFMPLRKGAQYEVIQRLGRQDAVVSLSTSPQARKQWPGLPERLTARLLSKTVKGKVCQTLTSMADSLRFPPDEIVDLYSHRREIELGFRDETDTAQQQLHAG